MVHIFIEVTAFIEKYESLAKSTNCDVTASAVIGHFPYYCKTDDVCETVRMLPGYRDDEIMADTKDRDAGCLPCA